MEVDFRGKCAELKKTHEYYPWGPLKGAGSQGTQTESFRGSACTLHCDQLDSEGHIQSTSSSHPGQSLNLHWQTCGKGGLWLV